LWKFDYVFALMLHVKKSPETVRSSGRSIKFCCFFLQVVKAYYTTMVSKSSCVHVGGIPKGWKLINLLETFKIFGPIISIKMMLTEEGEFGAL